MNFVFENVHDACFKFSRLPGSSFTANGRVISEDTKRDEGEENKLVVTGEKGFQYTLQCYKLIFLIK
jgi:hypothetical protein